MVRCGEYMCLRRSAIGPRIKEHPRFFLHRRCESLRIFTWTTEATGTKTTLSPVKAPVLNEPLTILLYNFVFRWSLLKTPRFINALFVRRLPPFCSPRSPQTLIDLFPPLLTQSFSHLAVEGVNSKLNKNDHFVCTTASTQLSVLECHGRRVLVVRWVTLTNPFLVSPRLCVWLGLCARQKMGPKMPRNWQGSGR